MRMHLQALLLLSAAALPAVAQTGVPGRSDFGRLQQYLRLSDAQLAQVRQNLDGYNTLAQTKSRRISQVHTEIVEETAREPLSFMALGQRYGEIEGMCRELRGEAAAIKARNLALLNAEQRTRLQALEEAIKLAPEIAQAYAGAFLVDGSITPYAFFSSPGITQLGIGSSLPEIYGCRLPFAGFRSGHFTGVINVPIPAP